MSQFGISTDCNSFGMLGQSYDMIHIPLGRTDLKIILLCKPNPNEHGC